MQRMQLSEARSQVRVIVVQVFVGGLVLNFLRSDRQIHVEFESDVLELDKPLNIVVLVRELQEPDSEMYFTRN